MRSESRTGTAVTPINRGSVCAVALVGDDAPQRPPAAGPGVGEVPGTLARIEAPAAGGEPLERDVDRRGEVRARRLRQDPHSAVVMLVSPGGRPGVVDRVD